MDENDIVIRDFVFKNPPGYKSDGFVHVQSMTVAFDLYSVYEAIRYGTSIKIHHFELAGVNVHIEKGTDGVGLNLWACLGATNHEQAKEVEGSVLKNITRAVKSMSDGTIMMVDVIAKYNPAYLLYSGIKSGDIQRRMTHIAANSLNVFHGSKKAGKSDSGGSYGEDEERSFEEDATDEDAHSTADSSASNPISPPRSEVSYKRQSARHHSREHLHSARNHAHEVDAMIDASERSPSNKDFNGNGNHWGIPYTLSVKEFTLRDVDIFAQDFLSAEHHDTSDLKSRAIRIRLMNMSGKELTNKLSSETKKKLGLESKNCQDVREPIYFDDLVWRLIGKAVNEVFINNKIAVTAILAHAALSHTTSLAAHVVSSHVMVDGANAVAGAAIGGGKVIVDGASKVMVDGSKVVAGVALEGGKAMVDGASGVVLGGGKVVIDGSVAAVVGGGKVMVDLMKGVGHTIAEIPITPTGSKRKSKRNDTDDVVSALNENSSDCGSFSEAEDPHQRHQGPFQSDADHDRRLSKSPTASGEHHRGKSGASLVVSFIVITVCEAFTSSL
jgi:hypothetical protein